MRRTEGLSSSLHACSCVTITSITCTSLNQKPRCSSYSFRRIKECDVPASVPPWPDCNIRERERIPSFWSVDTINCEWLVQVSRFSCFAFRVSQSIIRIAVEKKERWHVAFFNNASVARSFNSASRMESSVIDFRKVKTLTGWIKCNRIFFC